METIEQQTITNTVIKGKIIHLDSKAGWGFISSDEIQFTRIFFHWTALLQNTLHFSKLKFGMKLEFKSFFIPDKGWRAIKIKVIDNVLDKTETGNSREGAADS